MNEIIIYTDGSSRGNPGPGGWGAIILKENDSSKGNVSSIMVKEIGGRENQTTNNRMEMMAIIGALKYVRENLNLNENTKIEIFADSEYLIKGITIWIKNWQKNNWRTKDKKEVLNRDLWEKLLIETEGKNIEWKKVVGHSGDKLNDRCDEIATSFADNIQIDLYDGTKEKYFVFHSE